MDLSYAIVSRPFRYRQTTPFLTIMVTGRVQRILLLRSQFRCRCSDTLATSPCPDLALPFALCQFPPCKQRQRQRLAHVAAQPRRFVTALVTSVLQQSPSPLRCKASGGRSLPPGIKSMAFIASHRDGDQWARRLISGSKMDPYAILSGDR